MTNRIAVISIIIEETKDIEKLNSLLSEFGKYIIGRMGLPYRKYGVNIISVSIDAPIDIINALSGKIGKIEGMTAKTIYSKNEYISD